MLIGIKSKAADRSVSVPINSEIFVEICSLSAGSQDFGIVSYAQWL